MAGLVRFALIVGAIGIGGCSRSDQSLPIPRPPGEVALLPEQPPPYENDCATHHDFTMSIRQAEQLLRCTNMFAYGQIPPKSQVKAFNLLFEEPDALAKDKYVVGRLYALAALQLLDEKAAHDLALELKRRSHVIIVQDSDFIFALPIRKAVRLVADERIGQRMRDEWKNGWWAGKGF